MSDSPITLAFSEAAAKLNFSFEPSFAVTLPDGAVIESLGRLPQFGSKLGALLFSESQQPQQHELEELRDMGYFYSLLFESYHQFEEQHFKDTLNDWGYFGIEEDCPTWYSEEPWTR